MRKIDWTKKLSNEDIAWLRQAGIPGMGMDRVETHQAQFNATVPEVEVPNDTVTRNAQDPSARVADQVPGFDQLGAPQFVDPTQTGNDAGDAEDDADDYDQWKVPELKGEVEARNKLETRKTDVVVEGTGTDGNVTKPDLVKALRLWDQENPDVL